ncbi:MAG: SCP2 sterol-binding domain-containing protein [Gammaproteobacteria bacterium]|nr:SCP2 sterol-binding domain-containing protein [Gammaproteobacteria bacterium]
MSLNTLLTTTVLAPLQAALNRGLRLDPSTLDRLAALSGKAIEVRLRPFDVSFYILPGTAGIELAPALERAPDAVFAGTPLGLLRGALGRGGRRELFGDDLRIEGDTEIGRRLKSILDGIDIDWEEHASHLVGDIAAHKLGNIARSLGRWSRETGAGMADNLDEYLHEEARLVPQRAEVEEFLAAVDLLRTDADRLEQRIARLLRRLDKDRGGEAT